MVRPVNFLTRIVAHDSSQNAQHPFAAARYAELPAKTGGYESYYLKASAPDGESSVWIRHTVHRRPEGRARGSLWFVLFEHGAARPYAVKQTFDDLAAPGPAGALLATGNAVFGLGEVRGAAEGEGRRAEWELSLSGGADPLLHLPERLYTAPLPRTKSLTLLPEAVFDGRVRIADRNIELSEWRGMVGHNWGTQHAEQWVWLYGDRFSEGGSPPAEGSWLDLVAGRVRAAGLTTPWIANGALQIDGERLQLGGIGRVASTRVRPHVGRCEVLLRGEGVRVRATFEASRDQLVVWRYADPDGSEHHALNSSLADLSLTVERERHGPRRLSTRGRAVYEWGTRYTAHGVPVEPFPDG